MDSKWFQYHQASTRSSSSANFTENNEAGKGLDLSLKLGLPDHHLHLQSSHPSQPQHLTCLPMAPYMDSLSSTLSHVPHGGNQHGSHVGENQNQSNYANYNNYAITDEGRPNVAWSPEMAAGHYMNLSTAAAVTQYPGGSVVGVPAYPNNAFSHTGMPMSQLPTAKEYNFLDAFSSGTGGLPRAWQPNAGGNNNYPRAKLCLKCNTNDTPMWRKGPHGPKTLCNACGIKYRKQEEKKATEEAEYANG